MIHEIFSQLLFSFFQLFAFPTGGANFAEIAGNAQSAFLGSAPIHALQIISVLATLVLATMSIILVAKRKVFNQQQNAATEAQVIAATPLGALAEQWADILRHIESPREGEWKFAIIEADKLVDDVLKTRFTGDTMGERLMGIDKTKLLAIDGVWEAHKVRNRLAHDSNYFLRHAEALRAIRLFEAALRELGALS